MDEDAWKSGEYLQMSVGVRKDSFFFLYSFFLSFEIGSDVALKLLRYLRLALNS